MLRVQPYPTTSEHPHAVECLMMVGAVFQLFRMFPL